MKRAVFRLAGLTLSVGLSLSLAAQEPDSNAAALDALRAATPIAAEEADDTAAALDALLAATARVHRMTLATRNVSDIADLGALYLNPFEPR